MATIKPNNIRVPKIYSLASIGHKRAYVSGYQRGYNAGYQLAYHGKDGRKKRREYNKIMMRKYRAKKK